MVMGKNLETGVGQHHDRFREEAHILPYATAQGNLLQSMAFPDPLGKLQDQRSQRIVKPGW